MNLKKKKSSLEKRSARIIQNLKERAQQESQKIDINKLVVAADTWLIKTLDASIDGVQSNVVKVLKGPWVKNHMELNLTKLYYKNLKTYGISLGGFVEVKKMFFIEEKPTGVFAKISRAKNLQRFETGDKFLMLNISFEYLHAISDSHMWLTILHNETLMHVDAFAMVTNVKEGSIKELF